MDGATCMPRRRRKPSVASRQSQVASRKSQVEITKRASYYVRDIKEQQTLYIRTVVIVALSVAAAACDKTSGQAAAGAGGAAAGGRGGRGGRGGPAVAIQTTHVPRMSVQREVDLSGTLLSPDQAKVSSEVAGIIPDVPAQLGPE